MKQPGSFLGMASQWFETSIFVLVLVEGNVKLRVEVHVERVGFEIHCKI